MRQLDGHDASFLYSDTAHSNANVSLLQIYDQGTAPGGKVRFKSILAHIESRLAGAPFFRNRLQRVPLELDFPYWVEDEHFDLEYHVRHIALPKPGDWRQFCIQASRIHARPLDLNRPLWEIYVIEGLDSLLDLPRGSFALLTKIHHAAIAVDRVSDIALLLNDTTPEPAPPTPPAPWFPEAPPTLWTMLCRAGLHSMLSPLQMASPLMRSFGRVVPAALAFAADLLRPADQALVTRFNSVVSPHRVFDTRRFMVDEVERIRALVAHASLDDAVLAVCAGGLRRYLDALGELPDESLTALVPSAVGAAGRSAAPPWLRVRLGTDLADPVQRLRAIHDQTASRDALAQAQGARDLGAIGLHAPAATLALVTRLLGRSALAPGGQAAPASCTVAHVPGPTVPLYLNGARMTYFSAIMPIADGSGLVFAVTRYDGRIVVSPTSCRELMPDPQVFAQCVRDSFQEYLALATSVGIARRRPARATIATQEVSARRAAQRTPKRTPRPPARPARPRASASGRPSR